jgi:hypothetical protein
MQPESRHSTQAAENWQQAISKGDQKYRLISWRRRHQVLITILFGFTLMTMLLVGGLSMSLRDTRTENNRCGTDAMELES